MGLFDLAIASCVALIPDDMGELYSCIHVGINWGFYLFEIDAGMGA